MFKKNVPISLSDENIEIDLESLEDLEAPILEQDTTEKDTTDKGTTDKETTETKDNEITDNESSDNESSDNELTDNELDDKETSDNETSDNEPLINLLNDSDVDDSDDSDHSTVDLSDSASDDSNKTEEWETDDDSEEETDEIENLTLIVNKIPTQVVAIEYCDVTFDSILEKNEIRIEELESAMFQIIAMLYLYQKAFDFTHNDLHTNNVMCISTTEEFLHYKIMGKYYKIPTFGRIYKNIDFGRAIYTVNGTVLCSDSFSENGTAHTQYNCEPFYNPKKPLIKPNYSFDLCRLSCSMVDFIVEDIRHINNYRKVPIYDLIISWLYDDNGVNILYKKNGEERYPDFKLYKMIARCVHKHTPQAQLERKEFNAFIFPKKQIPGNEKVINIDEYPTYV
jgi:hypothetical protein